MTTLIEQLCKRADAEGRWSISSGEVAKILRIEPVRFWRAVHEARDRISFSEAIDGWNQDTVGDMVTVLESLGERDVEQEMTRAGLFLPYALGIELTEEVVFRARTLAASHDVRLEDLAAMVRHAGGVRQAISIYLNEYVDLDELFRISIESFQALHDLPQHGLPTTRRYLRMMVERHVLDRGALLVSLVERLRLAAAQLGYVDPEDQPRREARSDARQARRADRRTWALDVMGVDGQRFSAADLRLQYRRLMMQHHPDVDPSGLERCKDINAAYAILIAEVLS